MAAPWHVDLIMLGALTVRALRFMPELPRKVAVSFAAGAWVIANALGVLAFRPDLVDHRVYKAGVGASFVSATWGFTGFAAVAWRR